MRTDNIYKIVVLPAASKPTINILISFFENHESNIVDSGIPIMFYLLFLLFYWLKFYWDVDF